MGKFFVVVVVVFLSIFLTHSKCYGALTKEGGLITWQKSDFCMFPESVQNSETLHYANWFKGKNVVSLAMYSRQCLVLAADKE